MVSIGQVEAGDDAAARIGRQCKRRLGAAGRQQALADISEPGAVGAVGVEAEVRLVEEGVTDARYGLWFNYQDDYNFIFFGISNQGEYRAAVIQRNHNPAHQRKQQDGENLTPRRMAAKPADTSWPCVDPHQ